MQEVNPTLADVESVRQAIAVGCSLVCSALGKLSIFCYVRYLRGCMGIHEHAVRGHRKFLRLRTPHCYHSNACQLCINLAEYQGIGRIRNRPPVSGCVYPSPAVSLSLVFP
jgi:hypothetical protein